jgi:hypothetical protein
MVSVRVWNEVTSPTLLENVRMHSHAQGGTYHANIVIKRDFDMSKIDPASSEASEEFNRVESIVTYHGSSIAMDQGK